MSEPIPFNVRQCVNMQNSRARAMNRPGMIQVSEWMDILEKHNHSCVLCGSSANIQLDHIVPLSKGGTNVIANVQPLCKSCNSSKGANCDSVPQEMIDAPIILSRKRAVGAGPPKILPETTRLEFAFPEAWLSALDSMRGNKSRSQFCREALERWIASKSG